MRVMTAIIFAFVGVAVWLFIFNSFSEIRSTSDTRTDVSIGVWGPVSNYSHTLEHPNQIDQSKAISRIVSRGFDEYYFLMSDFENPKLVNSTESLLRSAEELNQNLKLIVILLPPSEGGPNGNYDWTGWIKYFNSLKQRHPKSFEGFTIDDFNWISTRNDTLFKNNIDFMEYSNLIDALKQKREDVKFMPTVYFEGRKTNVVINRFLNHINGIIAVSGCYYNVSALEPQLKLFRELFDNKPMKYIVYPTITHNYSRQYYSPPSDRLVISTITIASRNTDGVILWHDIDNPVIQEYMKYIGSSKAYISKINRMEEIQIEDELSAGGTGMHHINSAKNHCPEWYERYLHAYDYWLSLDSGQMQDNTLKEKLLSLIGL